ncbi:hypothetical protein Taro_016155 [Colocasia esculenta]|uniref:CO(2)-response secreted protease n=1 Tax=Colocasia esculenta TaxID=4460 RepID=A0A843UJL2_COLES|nr:hypothetical protein [Colocasia esculenta]
MRGALGVSWGLALPRFGGEMACQRPYVCNHHHVDILERDAKCLFMEASNEDHIDSSSLPDGKETRNSLDLHLASNEEPYIVYMGGSTDDKTKADPEDIYTSHLKMLATVIPSEEKERLSIGHSYRHSFKGFSAMLTEKEANSLSGHPGVVSVFRDRVLQLHTTRSWAFLEAEAGTQLKQSYPQVSDDVIIGVVDTGIWPESPSFSDAGIGAVPSRWKGVCMEASDFKKTHCNRKLIGARFYANLGDPIQPSSPNSTLYKVDTAGSPRDSDGHGTHTASTAAGAVVGNASYYGLARGTAKGGSPSSRLAAYKACSLGGCASSNILKAIDDAVADGVDIISISLGISSVFQSDFLSDPIAIGAFHAHQHGVLVVCSGGNDGPDPYTVINSAPWILTVAASSIDRSFQSTIVLGNGNLIKGTAINFSNLTRSKLYPLVFGGDVAAEYTPVYEASNCYPGSLDTEKTARKIVVCVDSDPTVSRRVKKLVAESTGARGLILVDEVEKGVAFDSGSFPFSEVSNRAGHEILGYINSTRARRGRRAPRATILPSTNEDLFKPAPVVAFFSSRGPGGLTESILKPDVMAPGVGILAASVPAADAASIPRGRKPSSFAIKSGTSMACPHVAGAAAFVKSVHSKWTPSMIKSALMTTATTANNLGKTITSSSGTAATYHEMGAGEITPQRAHNPGLVYETTTRDHLLFLCYYGYKQQIIHSISGGANFSCPANSSDALISDLNYPSISIAKLDTRRPPRAVTRTVTNVGPANSTYTATVDSPTGLAVRVSPARLAFSEGSSRASYDVTFNGKGAGKGYRFGSVTWSDGSRSVRTVFGVNVI